ncbi:hypothetical protein T484DRAFT_1891100, partial [Baffinella frigidus]
MFRPYDNNCAIREQELEEERRLASAVGRLEGGELEEERRLASAVGRLEGEVRAAGRAREEVAKAADRAFEEHAARVAFGEAEALAEAWAREEAEGVAEDEEGG